MVGEEGKNTEEIHQMIAHAQVIIEEKGGLIHQLKNNITKNTEAQCKVSEMKEMGKREAEFDFKRSAAEAIDEQKAKMKNVQSQYEHLCEVKDVELDKFRKQCEVYSSSKKKEIK